MAMLCLLAQAATAQTLYWDTNGKTAGAGGTAPAGTWSTANSDKNWNTTAAGTTTNPQTWTSGANAVFSAGTDATGAYSVTVSGTQNVSGITVQEGSPTLATGTINFSDASPDILVASGSTLTFANALTSGNNSLNLGSSTFTGTTVFSANTTLSGTVTLGGGTLSLAGSSYSFGTLNVTGNSTIDFAGATTLSLTSLTISSGVTLTIQNWTQASDYFFTANWSGVTQDIADNAGALPVSQVVFSGFGANQTGWDSYDNQIRPNVPEPSTYGALLLGALTGFFVWRRLVRRSAR
jgi:fibronectin-binding autotransporter adhesin